MKAKKLDATVVVGAILYGIFNIIPLVLVFVGFAVAFGAQDGSASTFISITFFGGIILWFLVPIAGGYIVARACGVKALRLGQTVDSQTAVVWGALATGLGQLPLSLCAAWFFASSITQTENLGLSSPILCFAIAVPFISALLGGLGGTIYYGLR